MKLWRLAWYAIGALCAAIYILMIICDAQIQTDNDDNRRENDYAHTLHLIRTVEFAIKYPQVFVSPTQHTQ